MNNKNFLAGLMAAAIFLSCNSPLQNKQERAAHDSANAPVQAPAPEADKGTPHDTTFGDFRISTLTRGNGNMRDLMIAVGSKKDTMRADTIIERDVKGKMKNMMITDLDGDSQPELYFFMVSEGTGHYGKIYAYNIGSQVIRINTNALDTMERAAYRGQDSFYIKGKTLVRTFPAYRESDPDALPVNTKGMILYNLKKEGDTLQLMPAK